MGSYLNNNDSINLGPQKSYSDDDSIIFNYPADFKNSGVENGGTDEWAGLLDLTDTNETIGISVLKIIDGRSFEEEQQHLIYAYSSSAHYLANPKRQK